MIREKQTKFSLVKAIFGCFFLVISLLCNISPYLPNNGVVYAEETVQETEEDLLEEEQEELEEDAKEDASDADEGVQTDGYQIDSCQNSLGALGWLVCPGTGKIAEAVDWLYGKIESILVINPISREDGSPIFEIWKYCRGLTNIVFIIFLLVVIYSQITGYGISNYGVKKALPKLIAAAVMVNLSFIICSLLVDVSNIVGSSLRGLFASVAESALANGGYDGAGLNISIADIYNSLAGGAALAIGIALIAFDPSVIWLLIPTVLGAIVAVVIGLVTIAMRQAVVALLIMVSPLAVVACILPNTEGLYKKWKNYLKQMLVFYPMFSLLFGASNLAGFAIITSAKDVFGLLLGIAVQIFPLFFSWSLMKMSGTVLGTIGSKLNSLAAGPLAKNRNWAESRRQQSRMNYLVYGRMPSAHLRRHMDKRRALREKHLENLQAVHANRTNMYVQRKISGKYDGTKAQGNSAYLKPNKYTRAAKDASTSHLMSEMATMDTTHVLNNYGDYFVARDVRERIKAAEKAGDKAEVRRIKMSNAESRRHMDAGNAFLEYSRAQMTAENDSEADFGFMVSNFLAASTKNKNPDDKDSEAFKKYRHYIVSSAGGLGETGQTRVLGKIIAKAAAVESNQRRDINIIANKFPPDKRNFRNFLFNYYIDDDGYATDKDGNRIEQMRDYLRVNEPEKLVMWDKYDENGPYFDWYDVNGSYVTRIYKKDKSAIKELMSNFDTPINDPINNMLAIHAGIKEQPNSNIPVYRHMGLDGFRTTIGRALLSAPFKDKNAAFSPMVAEMVKKGYITNYAQEYLAYLDSLNKATKPGAFNIQDGDAIDMFAAMMDPDRWEEIFPTELIRGYRNINGEQIYGIRYDENGNRIKVAAEEATREELMERIKEKFIIPAGKKITVMMSRQTQNTMDNQKAGTVEKWKKLKDVFDTKWGEGKIIETDPYEQNGDMREIKRDIQEALYTIDSNGNRVSFSYNRSGSRSGRPGNSNPPTAEPTHPHVNHASRIFEIFNSSLDADEFALAVSEYCSSYPELAWIADQTQDFIVNEGYGVTKDQIYEFVEEQLSYVDND